jgi:hypothetical protein
VAATLALGSAKLLYANAGLASYTVMQTPSKTAAVSAPKKLAVSTRAGTAIPTGSVLCGIDGIFSDGFEGTFTPVAQLSGGVASPGLTQDITGTLSSVAIVSPTGTTGDALVDVTGTFTGPVNTGITVNGVRASTANGQFLAANVPLNAGSNTLTATAASLTGTIVTGTGSITLGGSPSPLTINANATSGYTPFLINFTYAIGALPSGKPVQSVTINFKGSGANDFTGASLTGAPTSYSYSQSGLYQATLSVTDTSSNVYTANRAVLIQDLPTQRGMVCDVYGYLLDRLAAGDATNAGNAFQSDMRSKYLDLFNQLTSGNLLTMSQQLGIIVTGQMGPDFADLLLVRDNADQTRSGFPLRITVGADGVWRISEM